MALNFRTRKISFKTLFSHEKHIENWRYFNSRHNKISEIGRSHVPYRVKSTHDSYRGRYPLHTKFLRGIGNIKSFADIGCATLVGAPTTVDAKKALGKKARVYAVDLVNFPPRKKPKGVIPVIHSIVEKPLPFKVDAIRFANVTHYLSQSERRMAIANIWKSLNENGYLLGSTIYAAKIELENSQQRTYTDKEHEFILRKTENGFEEIIIG